MKYTKEQLLAAKPCEDGLKFASERGFDWVKIWQECPNGDWMIWWMKAAGQLDKNTAVKIALACAEHVLPIFEQLHPEDTRPKEALAAVAAWLANPSEENRKKAKIAAYASDAASAAYAASDAAAYDAAYAASSAAYAAAYAASAAWAASAAASADAAGYAAAARKKESQWQADKIRELIACPFVD